MMGALGRFAGEIQAQKLEQGGGFPRRRGHRHVAHVEPARVERQAHGQPGAGEASASQALQDSIDEAAQEERERLELGDAVVELQPLFDGVGGKARHERLVVFAARQMAGACPSLTQTQRYLRGVERRQLPGGMNTPTREGFAQLLVFGEQPNRQWRQKGPRGRSAGRHHGQLACAGGQPGDTLRRGDGGADLEAQARSLRLRRLQDGRLVNL